MVVANGTFVNASIIASGVGNVYLIGVEDQVAVNLAGTAAVSVGAASSMFRDPSHIECRNTGMQLPSCTL